MSKKFTPQQIAAISAGITLPSAPTAPAAPTTPVAAAAAAAVEGEGEAAAGSTGESGEPSDAELNAAPAPAPGPAQAEPDPVVQLLQTQLAAAQTEITRLSVANASASAAAASASAHVPALSAIVANSLSTMRTALGLTPVDMSAAAPDALVREHQTISAQFASAFTAGGVAAVEPESSAPANSGQSGAFTRAAVQATQFSRPAR